MVVILALVMQMVVILALVMQMVVMHCENIV